MKPVISQTFAITAQKPTVSVDHIDNYYITEASGVQPAANDSRWQFVPEGQQAPVPTSAAPYLWHKSITYLTDGSHLDPVIEFGGSLGQNGYDYDLVPSHSAIIKAQDDTVTPANVSCSLIKRNADGSAERITTPPAGYSVKVYRDTTAAAYTLGTNVSTANVSVVTFVLLYGTIEVERHDIRVIAEGAEGLTGRGIQSQSTRFKANTTGSVPTTPTNDNEWNTWSALSQCGYSETNRYLFQCVRTVFVDGNGNTSVEYLVSGPTVWGRDGDDAFVLDLDNEMDSLPCDSTGKVTKTTTIVVNVKLYKGATQITSGITAPTAASVKLAGVTPTVSQSSGNISVSWKFSVNTALADERYIITIPVTYNEKTYQVAFTLNALRSGAPGVSPTIYKVLPSHQSLAFSRNSSDTLTPSSHQLTCGYSKNYNGTISTVANQTTVFDTTYRIFYRYLSNGSWSAWYAYSSAITVSSSTAYTSYEFCIAKTTVANNVTDSLILDRETIPIIKSGQKGNTGANAFSLDIDNEMAAIPVNQQGKVETQKTLSFGLQAYYGTTAVGSSCTITANNIPSGFTVNLDDPLNPVVTIAADTTPAEISEITFRAVHATYGTREAVFTICAVKSGGKGEDAELYQLLPSQTTLPFNRNASGNINARSYTLTCQIQLVKGNTTTNYSSLSGYYLYYGWNGAASPSSILSTSGITVSQWYPNNGYTSLVLELWRGARSVSGSVRLDRETIPIITDGSRGPEGEGDPGNGIGVDDFYYCLTATPTPPTTPLTTANGWYKQGTSGCPTTPTNAKPYLWQCEHIEYTEDSSMNKNIIKLVQVYNMGIQPNLLEQTAFDSEDVMNKWMTANGEVIPQARGQHNAWGIFPSSATYREMLQQLVFSPGNIGKIRPANYYTLSFYSRTRRYINVTGDTYGFFFQNIYLKAGSYQLQFNGHCSQTAKNAGVQLNGYLWYSGDYGQTEDWSISVSTSIDTTADGTATTGILTVTRAGYYKMGFYAYKTSGHAGDPGQSVTVNWWRILCTSNNSRLDTYCYPSAVAGGTTYFVDGVVKTNLPGDTGIQWSLDNDDDLADNLGWTHHSVTFLTKSEITAADQKILFRIFNTYVEICNPKLEECIMATPWCEHEGDNDMHCDHNPCGTWRSGTRYYYCNGQRDTIQAAISASNTNKTWYRMKKRTTSQGYLSTTQPYLDTEHWEKASNLKFSIVDAMFAEEIFTDKLTVSKIRGANGKFTLDENGNVTAKGGTYDNITSKDGTFQNANIEYGEIGGWELASGRIGRANAGGATTYEGLSLYDEFICFNGGTGKQAILGTWSSLGQPMLVRLTDTSNDSLKATGIIFDFRNSNSWGYDRAFGGNGDGVLNGIMCGYKLNIFTPSSSNNAIPLKQGNNVLISGTYQSVYLPSRYTIYSLLGCGSTGRFAFDMYVMASSGTHFWLLGYRSGATDCPHIRNNDYGDQQNGIEMAAGDTVHLKIVYDGTNFDAYIISHRN